MAGETSAQAEDLRQAFHTNLLLLGFDQQNAEIKYKIAFNRDMFVLPNKRAFEVTAYFLFNRLDPVRCREQFRSCWPVFEKAQEASFRKGCVDWLAQVSKDDADAHLPRIVPSLFLSPGGDKFYALMHSFSTYVLLQVIKRELVVRPTDHLLHPILTPKNLDMADVMVKVIQCATVRHRARALEHMQTVGGTCDTWRIYADELVKEHRELLKKTRERQEDLQAVLKSRKEKGMRTPGKRSAGNTGIASSRLPHYSLDSESAKRGEQANKTRDLWKAMDAFFISKTAEREIVESVVQEVASSRPCLDASEFKLAIPDLLLRRCEMELARRNVGNIYKGGKVDLLSLLHLWNLSLHLYFEKFHDGGSLNALDAVPRLQTKAHVHSAEVKDLQALRLQLTNEVLPSLKKNIEDLSKKVDSRLFPDERSIPKQSSIGLGMLPYTPSGSRDHHAEITPGPRGALSQEAVDSFKLSMQLSPGSPELAARVIRSAVNASAYRPSPLKQGSPAAFSPLVPSATVPETVTTPTGKRPLLTADGLRIAAESAQRAGLPVDPGKQLPGCTAASAVCTSYNNPASIGKRPKASSLAAAEPVAASAARSRLAKQMVPPSSSRHRAENASTSQAWVQPASKVPVLNEKASSVKAVPEKMRQPVLPAATVRARAVLADKIVDLMLSGNKDSDNEAICQDSADELLLMNPVIELDETAFTSRERIRRTPPKDVYAHTVQQEAISQDEEEIDIVTAGSGNDSLRGTANWGAGATYGELFRAYLRDNGALDRCRTPPQEQVLVAPSALNGRATIASAEQKLGCMAKDPAPVQVPHSKSSSSSRSVEDDTVPQLPGDTLQQRFSVDLAAKEDFDLSPKEALVRNAPGQLPSSLNDTNAKDEPSLKHDHISASTTGASASVLLRNASDVNIEGFPQASNFAPAADIGPVKSCQRAAKGCQDVPGSESAQDGLIPAPGTGQTVHGASSMEKHEINELEHKRSGTGTMAVITSWDQSPAATSNKWDQLEETPRAVHFTVDAPPLFPTSMVMRLSLTPSSPGSSSFESPRIMELSDDEAVDAFLRDDRALGSSPGTAASNVADADSSPTTEDLFKRLQALKLQAAISVAGPTNSRNITRVQELLFDTLNEGNGCLLDDDASILDEYLVASPP